jgi:hypothetical protein
MQDRNNWKSESKIQSVPYFEIIKSNQEKRGSLKHSVRPCDQTTFRNNRVFDHVVEKDVFFSHVPRRTL